MCLKKRLVQFLRNLSEFLGTVELDQEQEFLVFFLGPDWRLLDIVVLSLSLPSARAF